MKQLLLLLVVALAVAFAVAVGVHPDGLVGVERLVGLGPPDSEASSAKSPLPGAWPTTPAERAENELTKAEAAYDRGEFRDALTFFGVAGVAATDETQRRRASVGAERAVLAWALVDGAGVPDLRGASARERLAELLEKARVAGTEDAWLDVVLLAQGAGLKSELPAAVAAAYDVAVHGGPVERRAANFVGLAGPHAKALRAALAARGLDVPADFEPTFTEPLRHPGSHDDGPSGIGGVGAAAPLKVPRVPRGAFDDAMRRRLEQAVIDERDGLEHFRLAGPDGTDRPLHRREAYRLLKKARDVYNDALEMDPRSSDCEARMQETMRALALASKEGS